jgi:hypothetical protein
MTLFVDQPLMFGVAMGGVYRADVHAPSGIRHLDKTL